MQRDLLESQIHFTTLLKLDIFDALQLLKSAYRNGHISAPALAFLRIDALIAELDEDFGYDNEDEDPLAEG
ncbi:hypothetical protein C8R45DRAFT_1113859 [Mycena sanguinolenta]|nr:hypothetical protein C8R45DRAFT_1113859 [Mycena sanguinolenta]